MTAIPLFFQIEERKILIVGGGRSAGIKLQTLLAFSGNITMVTAALSSEVAKLAAENTIAVYIRPFVPLDLQDVALVFAAAERTVNDYVHSEAKKRGILCCKAEGGGDFILPACKTKGSITVAVSTNGKFPMLAKKMLESMDLSVAQHLDDLEKCRRLILDNTIDRVEARKVLQEIANCAESPLELELLLERIGYEKH